jgi:hypothetical protein
VTKPDELGEFFMFTNKMIWQIDEYMLYCQSKQLSEKTMESYEQTLHLFERWCGDEMLIENVTEITEGFIRRYINDLQTRGKYTVCCNDGTKKINCPERRRDFRQPVSVTTIKDYDKVENITWYKPQAYPYYANSRSYVLPYIGVDSYGNAWLRLVFHYTGDSWIFFKKITVSVDVQNYVKDFDYFEVSRDNGSGDVWEYVDISPSGTDINMLRAIAASKETIVRFQGDDYHYDLTVKSSDKSAIISVLDAYSLL